MYTSGTVLQGSNKTDGLKFNEFSLKDIKLIKSYVDAFNPLSCEYNFSNLFTWQEAYRLSWTLYRERLLIYDGLSQYAFMPIGKALLPEEMVMLSISLKNVGRAPDFCLATPDYLKKFPGIEKYYTIKKEPDAAEYIYDVNRLCELTGSKLHKKRNLISQFKRTHPDFEVCFLTGDYKSRALALAQELMNRQKRYSKTLDHEFYAIKKSFEHFELLSLEGLVITIGEKVVAFSVFSQLGHSTYDIQFEKSDMDFKGAAQVINHETAKYLKNKCRYLNREQDLGIKGLRQAKMSYEPVHLITPYSLAFTPLN